MNPGELAQLKLIARGEAGEEVRMTKRALRGLLAEIEVRGTVGRAQDMIGRRAGIIVG